MTEDHRPEHVERQKTEDRFRLLVESVKDYGIFMLSTEGHIVSWNAGAERIKGYAAHEIIGSHFSRFYSAEDHARGKPEYELEQATKLGRFEDEGFRLRKDGSTFWADVVITALRDPETGELKGFGKVTRDLTERKQAEEKLRQSEEQFRLLVESVQEYAIFMLSPTGHVATWNSGAEKIKGYSVEEIIGESFERFYLPEDRAAGKPQRLLREAETHGQVRDQGVRMCKDGSTFQAEVLITAVHDATGVLRGFAKITRDVTDQIRTREAEMARIAAERASKAKDDFLAVLSHELRTPLTPVLATANYLFENASTLTTEDLVDSLGVIRRNARLEAQLIDDLLDLTRISQGKIEVRPEAVDLHTAVQDAIGICQEEIMAKRLTISCELEAREHWAWADPTRTRQVFWNLLSNAVKFTPAEGRILLSSANGSERRITISVADSGIGIEPQQIVRVFEAFEQGERTVTRRFGGLGLGLAITRSIVEMHQGELSVQSEGKGKGACFLVTLACIEPPSATTAAEAPASGTDRRRLRILLVDDHGDTRRILTRLLTAPGYEVETADRVQAALDLIQIQEPFDLIISDIGLPDGSGHELMQRARALQPHLRGIALSGFGMEEDLRRSKEAGFEFHLTKPVDITALREALAKLSGW